MAPMLLLTVLMSITSADGFLRSREASLNQANPIRKVVTMLQNMQKKIEAEGEKEKELFEKYMCYCKNAGGDLSASVSAAEAKIPNVGSSIKEGEAKLKQLKEDLKQHQVDRSAAKKAMAEATALREKEASEYAKVDSELKANIAAVTKATAAIEKGMGDAFLQTDTAMAVRQAVLSRNNMLGADRDEILSFLSGAESSSEFAPSSGEISGILKTLKDEMSASLGEATKSEKEKIADHEGMMASKEKEVKTLTKSIEVKTGRIGELAVKIVEMKNDLSDTEESLVEDKKFLKDLDKNCATKEDEWAEIQKTRSEELLALADTIKILNDDDALELFKKTLPGASSFMQVVVTASAERQAALNALKGMKHHPLGVDFIAMAMRGKKVGFEKVIKMIDDMVASLKKEQLDDDHKKEYCEKQFDMAADKKKELERSISDLETAIADAKEGIATTADEIKALEAGIKELDKSVAEATEQRKEENADFTSLMASDAAAKELLKFAANRLNKFYNPKLYKAPPKRELTEEERISVNMGGTLAPTAAPGGIAGTGVTVLAEVSEHGKAAPPPPPEAPGAYKKKSEESGGVMAMIDLMVKDLDKEMHEAKATEKAAQEDYEKMMGDSAEKRAADTKSLTEKGATKAEMQSDLEANTETKVATGKELMGTMKYISSLHGECDWLLQYFDVRKEARVGEIDALTKAKAVLSGADYSFVQTRHFLRHA